MEGPVETLLLVSSRAWKVSVRDSCAEIYGKVAKILETNSCLYLHALPGSRCGLRDLVTELRHRGDGAMEWWARVLVIEGKAVQSGWR